VPREFNYLLNPAHRDIARIREVGREAVVLDERLFSKTTKKKNPRRKTPKRSRKR
jgi:hypothetical protein